MADPALGYRGSPPEGHVAAQVPGGRCACDSQRTGDEQAVERCAAHATTPKGLIRHGQVSNGKFKRVPLVRNALDQIASMMFSLS